MLKSFFVFILCFSFGWCNKFQLSKEPLCHIDDNQCKIAITNKIIEHMYGGDSKIALAQFDPLEISRMSLKQGGQSPVNVEINFNNVRLHGLRHFKLNSLSGFNRDPHGVYEMRLKGPQFILEGPYTIKGQILVLPIQGQGHSNFTLDNPEMHIRFTGKTKKKNGKIHLYTDDLKMTFKITKMHAYFGNLYNGDKALGETTNLFLNDNWRDIYNEIKGSIFDAFSLIMQSMLNNLFAHHDYNHLFQQ